MPVIHISPVDHSGTVRCYIHELEASRRSSQSEGNRNRTIAAEGSEDSEKCEFFYWVDELTEGTPHQLPTPASRTQQGLRTPSKSESRMTAIHKALLESSHGNQLSAPSSSNRVKVMSPGRQKREQEIRDALLNSSSHGTESNDANVFQSSQPPPSQFHLSFGALPSSQPEDIDSDEETSLVTPPTTQLHKRSRREVSEEPEPDFHNTPSKSKRKNKTNTLPDPIATASGASDASAPPSSQKLTGILEELKAYQEYVEKLERQVRGLTKSKDAKQKTIDVLTAENEALRRRLEGG
ncbi:hypothetical protein BDP27DRAFT_1336602 [Rhodocollybia butyracea]|uniref:Uncharacterized protein n=1 Tax=Rhodocollybia butyracea TaxID=206335 RepID=A0A9P5U116_9AGAR|nr:hypothetical protein BDP27DRAFT_1336602 [Rhodocollybia butyracea]